MDASALLARPLAHRGLHDKKIGVIENTISAAKAAIARGFGIECDVQISADGEAMVFHDFGLDRLTTGTGKVSALRAEVLTGIPMLATEDRIVPLTGLLQTIAGRVPLVVEIKSLFDGDMRLTRRTAAMLKSYAGPFGIKSFDPRIVAEVGRLAPEMPRGIVAMNDYAYSDYAGLTAADKHALANLLHFQESRPSFVSWRVKDLPSAAPFLCRRALGLPLMTWTVRNAEERRIAAAHADQIVFEGFVP